MLAHKLNVDKDIIDKSKFVDFPLFRVKNYSESVNTLRISFDNAEATPTDSYDKVDEQMSTMRKFLFDHFTSKGKKKDQKELITTFHLLMNNGVVPYSYAFKVRLNKNFQLDKRKFREGEEIELPLSWGVNLISGTSGMGKSILSNYIANVTDSAVYSRAESVIGSSISHSSFNNMFNTDESIIIIDSMTNYVTASGKEAAGSGGISYLFLEDLLAINNAAMSVGKTVVIVINNKAVNQEVIDTIAGRVATYMNPDQIGKFIYTSRAFANREPIWFSVPHEYIVNIGIKDQDQVSNLVLDTLNVDVQDKNIDKTKQDGEIDDAILKFTL